MKSRILIIDDDTGIREFVWRLDRNPASSLQRGEWEHDAADTVRSLVHYTIGLAVTAALIATYLVVRRRRAPAPLGTGAVQQTGGAPTTSASA